jgi:S1-C subfamily serine protease
MAEQNAEPLASSATALPSRADLITELLSSVAMVEDHSAPDRDRVVGRNIRGTAFVIDERGYFVIDERGYFVTAKHVVRGLDPRKMELRTVYSRWNPGTYAMGPCRSIEAIYPHPYLDVAVIAVGSSHTKGRVRRAFRSDGLRLGDDVLLMGYAHGTELVFADDILGDASPKSLSPVTLNGMICARIPDDGRRVRLFAYDCTTFPGCNGGALVSTALGGVIVGLHLRGMSNRIGYAVPIEDCMAFVEVVARLHERGRAGRYRSQGG